MGLKLHVKPGDAHFVDQSNALAERAAPNMYALQLLEQDANNFPEDAPARVLVEVALTPD